MVTFTNPIRYANQDFDEYQAARCKLGVNHAEWYARQSVEIRELRKAGAWAQNNTDKLNAYLAIERFEGLESE